MEITTIKENLSILQVLSHYGLHPNKSGMLNCPFHDDKTPSMQVYEKTNTVYCFSSNCETHGKSLDVIAFIELKDKCTKHEAINRCKELLGVLPKSQKTNSKKQTSEDQLELFYRFKTSLSKSKKANEYLKSRYLDKTKLELGFNPQGSKYAHLKNCLVFPLKNKAGEIVSFYGRSVAPTGNKSKPNTSGKHYYLSGRSGLYPNYPQSTTETLILTEAIIDCATLISYTDHHPKTAYLSLYGTNGLTNEHTEAIKQLKHLKEIILFFDGDEAGLKASG